MDDGSGNYGGFHVGVLGVALPMAALREVQPCMALQALPCGAPGVVGALDLRGVLVPVMDLRRLLGLPAPDGAAAVVVVMVWQQRILGLLAEGVSGVFQGRTGSLHRTRTGGAGPQVLAGSLQRDDDGTLVSLLSPEALASLPGVPLVDDPEPGRLALASDADGVPAEAPGAQDAQLPRPTLLVRCGTTLLALDAMAVHATLSDPQVKPSAAAVGHCRGLMDYAGAEVPAVDLLALCGLGALPPDQAGQAFVVRMPTGLLALLVSEVIDVVQARPGEQVPVPAFALPVPGLFAGALPMAGQPDAVAARLRTGFGVPPDYALLLSGAALQAEPALGALASLVHTDAAARPGFDLSGATAGTEGQRALITYDLMGESATPIDQIAEILPYTPDRNTAVAGGVQGAMLGLAVSRGRSIPVLCLRRLAGAEPVTLGTEASVLVVQSRGEWLGFAVPRLRTIESARWEPELPPQGMGRQDHLSHALKSRRMALVGRHTDERMLRMLDLASIAESLQG